MNVRELRRFFESLPADLDEVPVVIAPSPYEMPAESSRIAYIPDEDGGVVSIGPVVLVQS